AEIALRESADRVADRDIALRVEVVAGQRQDQIVVRVVDADLPVVEPHELLAVDELGGSGAGRAGDVEARERVAFEIAVDHRILWSGGERRAVDLLIQDGRIRQIAEAGEEARKLREELRAADARVCP